MPPPRSPSGGNWARAGIGRAVRRPWPWPCFRRRPALATGGQRENLRQFAPALAAGQSDMAHSLAFCGAHRNRRHRVRIIDMAGAGWMGVWIPFFTREFCSALPLIWIFNRPGSISFIRAASW